MNEFFDKTNKRMVNKDSHAFSDVDDSRDALHHTLGPGPNQAAQGNHTHDSSKLAGSKDVTGLAIPAAAGSGATSSCTLHRRGNQCELFINISSPTGTNANTDLITIPAEHTAIVGSATRRDISGTDSASGGLIPIYFSNLNSIRTVFNRAAGSSFFGYITYLANS